MSTFRVYYEVNDEPFDEYYEAKTAQEVADYLRDIHMDEAIEIIDIAKVVHNWR